MSVPCYLSPEASACKQGLNLQLFVCYSTLLPHPHLNLQLFLLIDFKRAPHTRLELPRAEQTREQRRAPLSSLPGRAIALSHMAGYGFRLEAARPDERLKRRYSAKSEDVEMTPPFSTNLFPQHLPALRTDAKFHLVKPEEPAQRQGLVSSPCAKISPDEDMFNPGKGGFEVPRRNLVPVPEPRLACLHIAHSPSQKHALEDEVQRFSRPTRRNLGSLMPGRTFLGFPK